MHSRKHESTLVIKLVQKYFAELRKRIARKKNRFAKHRDIDFAPELLLDRQNAIKELRKKLSRASTYFGFPHFRIDLCSSHSTSDNSLSTVIIFICTTSTVRRVHQERDFLLLGKRLLQAFRQVLKRIVQEIELERDSFSVILLGNVEFGLLERRAVEFPELIVARQVLGAAAAVPHDRPLLPVFAETRGRELMRIVDERRGRIEFTLPAPVGVFDEPVRNRRQVFLLRRGLDVLEHLPEGLERAPVDLKRLGPRHERVLLRRMEIVAVGVADAAVEQPDQVVRRNLVRILDDPRTEHLEDLVDVMLGDVQLPRHAGGERRHLVLHGVEVEASVHVPDVSVALFVCSQCRNKLSVLAGGRRSFLPVDAFEVKELHQAVRMQAEAFVLVADENHVRQRLAVVLEPLEVEQHLREDLRPLDLGRQVHVVLEFADRAKLPASDVSLEISVTCVRVRHGNPGERRFERLVVRVFNLPLDLRV